MRPRHTVSMGLMIAALALPGRVEAASDYDDAFGDSSVGTEWTVLNDVGSPLTLAESGGRLNLLSPGGGVATNDTLYLSNFRLSTAADFTVRIDHYLLGVAGPGANGDRLGLTFGVGRDLPDGTDSAAIGVGFGNVNGFVAPASTIAYRTDDVQVSGPSEVFSPLVGTLEIGYVAATDVLTLKRISSSTFIFSLPPGTVRGTGPGGWGATELVVAVGGRGSGLAVTSGQLTLDDFRITQGVVDAGAGVSDSVGDGKPGAATTAWHALKG